MFDKKFFLVKKKISVHLKVISNIINIEYKCNKYDSFL